MVANINAKNKEDAVAKMSKNYYRPGDSSSSPFEPAMGDIVLYRTFKKGAAQAETFPAIIVRTYSGDKCDLTVFSSTGVRYVLSVRFSSDDQTENTWGWLPEKVVRETDPDVKPTTGQKPVDKKTAAGKNA